MTIRQSVLRFFEHLLPSSFLFLLITTFLLVLRVPIELDKKILLSSYIHCCNS